MATIKKAFEPVYNKMVELDVEARIGKAKFAQLVALMEASRGGGAETILKDEEGNMLGRMCTVTNKFFPADRFFKGTTIIKEADSVKAKFYTESKAVENEAKKLLEEARELEEATEKLAKFEAYDKEMERAKQIRSTPVEVKEEWLEGGFDTIEELKASLEA